jgi:hypothetical protein
VNVSGAGTLDTPGGPIIDLEARLNWSEYLNGQWSAHESSAFDSSGAITFAHRNSSHVKDIFIYVSKEYRENGVEGGVFVHLAAPGIQSPVAKQICRPNEICDDFDPEEEGDGGGQNQPGNPTETTPTRPVRPQNSAFYLAGRNSSPDNDKKDAGQPAPSNPYPTAGTRKINRNSGAGALTVTFRQRISTEPGESEEVTRTILGQAGGQYTLLPLNHTLGLRVPEEAYKDATKPEEVKEALENSRAEIESLIGPVFFQDGTHTFFVEPNVVERTLEEWQLWAPPTEPPRHHDGTAWLDWVQGHVEPFLFEAESGNQPGVRDWLVNPMTVIRFDGQAIGALGSVPLTFQSAAGAELDGATVQVSGAVGAAEVGILGDGLKLEEVGLTEAGGGLQVVGAGGVNVGLIQNVSRFRGNGLNAGRAGIIRQ